MLRTTRLLTSTLFVIALSVLNTRVSFPQVQPIYNCDNPAGTPSLCNIRVIAVQKRSACDLAHDGYEWWVQVKNTSTTESFKVQITSTVFSGVPESQPQINLCTESADSMMVLVPGACGWVTKRFKNETEAPGRPCDSQCCKDHQNGPVSLEWELCNTPEETPPPGQPSEGPRCTKILSATVKVTHWINPNGRPSWQPLSPQPTIAAIENGMVTIGAETDQCRIFDFCRQQDPHYRQWEIGECDPRL